MKLFSKGKDQPLSCKDVGKVIQTYLDSEMDDDEAAAAVAAHLDDCERCGLEAETLSNIKTALARRAPQLDGDVLERLRAFGTELTGD